VAFAKAPTIAVVVDNVTYDKAKSSVDNYCRALEEEGKNVALFAQAWENPESVREALSSVSDLEGAVFIGDIPIAMVQDAQHLTSAFKIDQTRFKSQQRISVATDRYYDDPDLVFDFLKQDEENPLLFYYSLSRKITPIHKKKYFYSGRIISPVHDDSKYEMIDKISGSCRLSKK